MVPATKGAVSGRQEQVSDFAVILRELLLWSFNLKGQKSLNKVTL